MVSFLLVGHIQRCAQRHLCGVLNDNTLRIQHDVRIRTEDNISILFPVRDITAYIDLFSCFIIVTGDGVVLDVFYFGRMPC